MSEELKRGIPKAIPIGEEALTPDEIRQNEIHFTRILQEAGVISENQCLRGSKIVNKDNK